MIEDGMCLLLDVDDIDRQVDEGIAAEERRGELPGAARRAISSWRVWRWASPGGSRAHPERRSPARRLGRRLPIPDRSAQGRVLLAKLLRVSGRRGAPRRRADVGDAPGRSRASRARGSGGGGGGGGHDRRGGQRRGTHARVAAALASLPHNATASTSRALANARPMHAGSDLPCLAASTGAGASLAALLTAVLEQGSRLGILGADYDSSPEWSDCFTALFGVLDGHLAALQTHVEATKAGDKKAAAAAAAAAGNRTDWTCPAICSARACRTAPRNSATSSETASNRASDVRRPVRGSDLDSDLDRDRLARRRLSRLRRRVIVSSSTAAIFPVVGGSRRQLRDATHRRARVF